jgi:hypothetical protein
MESETKREEPNYTFPHSSYFLVIEDHEILVSDYTNPETMKSIYSTFRKPLQGADVDGSVSCSCVVGTFLVVDV